MTLSMVMRSRAPDGRSASECKGKPLRSHPGFTYGHQNAGRRPGTKADLSGRSENRYDPPRVQGSSGESRSNGECGPAGVDARDRGRRTGSAWRIGRTMNDDLKFQLRLTLRDEFAQVARNDPADPSISA